jgi:curli biogenesis system outer membrane secretion channel CsgG
MKLKPLLFLLMAALFLPGAGCESMSQGMGNFGDSLTGGSGGSNETTAQTSSTNSAGNQAATSGEPVRVASSEEAPPPATQVNSSRAKFKKVIAVSRFENRAKHHYYSKMGTGMADQLADALVNSNNFVVVERQTLSDVMGEQNLANSGRAAKSKSAQIGKIVPAQILIKGTVTEFEEKSGGSGSGFSFGGIQLGSDAAEAHVGVILRIIDSSTGQVLASERVEGKAKSGGTTLGLQKGGFGYKSSGFKKTSLGKAVQIVIDRAVVRISKKLDPIPFEGKVIKVSGGTVFTNIGKRNGLSQGESFTIFSPGEEMIDPDTGENLGSDRTEVGKIKITSVKEKFSKASIESGDSFEKGFIVKE